MSDGLAAVRVKFGQEVVETMRNAPEHRRRWCLVYQLTDTDSRREVDEAERALRRAKSDVDYALRWGESVASGLALDYSTLSLDRLVGHRDQMWLQSLERAWRWRIERGMALPAEYEVPVAARARLAKLRPLEKRVLDERRAREAAREQALEEGRKKREEARDGGGWDEEGDRPGEGEVEGDVRPGGGDPGGVVDGGVDDEPDAGRGAGDRGGTDDLGADGDDASDGPDAGRAGAPADSGGERRNPGQDPRARRRRKGPQAGGQGRRGSGGR